MPLRRSTALLVSLSMLLVVSAAACGDDGKAAPATSSTTTTVVPSTTGATAPTPSTAVGAPATTAPDATSTPVEKTVSDAVFDEQVKAAAAKFDTAGTDLCKIIETGTGDLPTPSTANQLRTAVDYLDRVFTAMANALPATAKATADQLRSALKDLHSEAEASNYDPKLLGDNPKAFSSPDFTKAMQTIMAMTQSCPGN